MSLPKVHKYSLIPRSAKPENGQKAQNGEMRFGGFDVQPEKITAIGGVQVASKIVLYVTTNGENHGE